MSADKPDEEVIVPLKNTFIIAMVSVVLFAAAAFFIILST